MSNKYKTKQCWRCLRWYSYRTHKDGIHCPACGLIVEKVRKQPPPLSFIYGSITPFDHLPCAGGCGKIKEHNHWPRTYSWWCEECYEEQLRHKCDMCDEQKPNDKGKWISPHGFWWCDSCEEKYQNGEIE